MIGTILGAAGGARAMGDAVKGVAEVIVPSATRQIELSAEAQMAALQEMGAEFGQPAFGWFDRFVNGLNRLPRPALAFGTIGLFVYAMMDPFEFARRMVGLNAVPEPLWWLLGAVVAFYFGARETHYFRNRPVVMPFAAPDAGSGSAAAPDAEPTGRAASDPNPALQDWRGDAR
jgi:hypothetical protein